MKIFLLLFFLFVFFIQVQGQNLNKNYVAYSFNSLNPNTDFLDTMNLTKKGVLLQNKMDSTLFNREYEELVIDLYLNLLDSTYKIEYHTEIYDPNNPGVLISAPIKLNGRFHCDLTEKEFIFFLDDTAQKLIKYKIDKLTKEELILTRNTN